MITAGYLYAAPLEGPTFPGAAAPTVQPRIAEFREWDPEKAPLPSLLPAPDVQPLRVDLAAREMAARILALDTYEPGERIAESDARFRDAVRALAREVLR